MTRVVCATRGGLAFLTRLPVRLREGDWEAFRETPTAFPLAGTIIGALVAIPLFAVGVLPAPTVAVGYLLAVYLVTGIHHLDGVADMGDAVVVHGDAERRREVLKDTTTGVGALLAVSVVVAGIGLAGLALATLPALVAVGVALAAEVGAKAGMAALACFSRAGHEGMGSSFTGAVSAGSFPPVVAVCAPAAAVTWPHPIAGVALLGALAGAAIPWLWARRRLGGVTGDVFGAANELGRLAGLHAGVIAWTLY